MVELLRSELVISAHYIIPELVLLVLWHVE
jgi:hypothetical protein